MCKFVCFFVGRASLGINNSKLTQASGAFLGAMELNGGRELKAWSEEGL